jgi:putative membrane protein
MRKIQDYLILAAKGFGMGSADVVPGVSGGTIAFITGIYEELIESIKSVNLEALKQLRKGGLAAAWKHINGNFLVAVFAGIIISIFSLAKGLSYLLENYPVLLWSFFFGLIIASSIFVGRKVRKWDAPKVLTLIAGGAIAFFITTLSKVETPHDLWFIFIAGAIAICAMILPGISGSFLLVIMGQYAYVLESVKELRIEVVLTFAAGCAVGLLSFARLISYLFKKFHDHTIAILTGFMIGSLNKVWPWKNTLESYQDRHDVFKPLVQENVLPADYNTVTPVEARDFGITEKPDNLLMAIGLCVGAILLVWALEWLGNRNQKPSHS